MEEVALSGASYFVLIPNTIRQIKSRRMGWAGHVARMGQDGQVYKFLVGKAQKKAITRKTEE
jgi:hypothetical protein